MIDNTPSPPSLPTLSPSLHTQFNTLSGGDVRLFKQVFMAVWRWLWPVSRFDPLVLAYTLPVVLDQVEPTLTIHQWFTLCKLYTLSRGGADAVNTRNYPFTKVEGHHIVGLQKHGIVLRTSFDPAHPHLVRPAHINKTYISFTGSGITFYKSVVKEMHKTSHNDSYLLTVGHKTNNPDS